MDKLTISNMELYYGDFKALKGINLNIQANEITAFIGPYQRFRPLASMMGASDILLCPSVLFELAAGERRGEIDDEREQHQHACDGKSDVRAPAVVGVDVKRDRQRGGG